MEETDLSSQPPRLPPRGTAPEYEGPPPQCQLMKSLDDEEGVYMNMCGECHACPTHCSQCNGKKNIVFPVTVCCSIKLTVLKLPDVVFLVGAYGSSPPLSSEFSRRLRAKEAALALYL